MAYADPEMKRAYNRAWYQTNKVQEKEKSRQAYHASPTRKAELIKYGSERGKKIGLMMKTIKAKLSCERCGNSDPRVLQFHHNDPQEKDSDLAKMSSKRWGEARIMKEIAKCTVLCANCHIIFHCENPEL